MLTAKERFIHAFQKLSRQRKFEIVGILAEVVAGSSPALMKDIINQIEAERKDDRWDNLTKEQQQNLLQQQREANAGTLKTISHQQVQREGRKWLDN